MANPSALTDKPAVIVATTGASSITLDTTRSYTVEHTGLDNAGSASTDLIFGSYVAAVDNDASEGDDKIILQPDRAIVIGPNVAEFKFQAAAGTPTMQFVPGT